MVRRRLPPEVESDGFDMTPMIDCTFQLIIFFMLVTDMSRVQTEKLTLPVASRALAGEGDPPLVLNVMTDGKVRISGRTFDDGALETIFAAQRPKANGLVAPLLIRADRSTSFEHVQKVMMIASSHGQVTRVQFGARKE